MKIIVDSGSTKTTWHVCLSEAISFTVTTTGINPVRDSEEAMRDVVRQARSQIDSSAPPTPLSYTPSLHGRAEVGLPLSLSPLPEDGSGEGFLWFYGAGCMPPFSEPLERLLKEYFPHALISVASDLLGAAHALCQHNEGIACILGTGANSCLYDGQRIVANTPALGWILGDEGSGAVLGRILVSDVLKSQLPETLCSAFLQRFNLTPTAIIEAVYRQPQPNRFLASLVPFLTEHRDDNEIHTLLVDAFRSFFRRNVAPYNRHDLNVGFVGGIAYQFENELCEAACLEDFVVGDILCNPIQKMAAFHAN